MQQDQKLRIRHVNHTKQCKSVIITHVRNQLLALWSSITIKIQNQSLIFVD